MQVPLWLDAFNVRFYQGKIRRLVPPANVFDTPTASNRMSGLHQQQMGDGVRYIWAANNGSISRWYGPPAEAIGTVPFTANQTMTAPATIVDFLAWGDWTLVNPSSGPIKRFTAPGDFATLPNAPTDVVTILKKANQMFAIGHGTNKRMVSWSDADDITNWDYTNPESLANLIPIEELDTPIRAGAKLASYISVYAEDQMALVYWVGAPSGYGQRLALDGIGAVGKAAVASDGRLNYGVSRNGVWRTDGQDFGYVDPVSMNDYLQENVNWDQSSKIIALRNDVTRCFEFYFPMGSSLNVNEGWSFDPSNGGWSEVQQHQIGQERKLFDKPLVADGFTVKLMDDNPALPGPLTLVTKPMQLQNAKGEAMHIGAKIDEVQLLVKKATAVDFRYEVAEDIDGPWTVCAYQTLQPDLRTYQLEDHPSGTYHLLRFRSTLDNWDLDLQGFALYGAIDGQTRDAL